MNIIEKLVGLISKKDSIVYSKLTNISTKFGLFQMQAYKDKNNEYLAIMSRDFFDLDAPIVYIHSNFHIHSEADSNIRYASNGINSMLKMISKQGGVLICHSKDGRDIDEILKSLNARKLEQGQNIMSKGKIPLSLKFQSREYQVLGFILKNLNLSAIRLISHDINLTIIIEQLGIDILKRVEAISFEYGR